MKPQKAKKSRAIGILYYLIVMLIGAVWIVAFKSYFANYDSMHPEITWVVPWVQVDMVTAEGIFLWSETKLAAPVGGTVRYSKGLGPRRVMAGEVVANVVTGSATHAVKAPQAGYFVAGLDGLEGKWRYAEIWPGVEALPTAPPLQKFSDGDRVSKGAPIGKVILQPQDLRFIGYTDLSDALKQLLEMNKVMVKMDPLDTPSKAHVRVYEDIGHRAKIYLNLPWFPLELAASRNYELIIEAGETSGVAVPESATTMRGGVRGAFVLRGSYAVFVPLEGRVISGSRFLATKGLKLGDAVILQASGAKEGRVKLW